LSLRKAELYFEFIGKAFAIFSPLKLEKGQKDKKEEVF